jgi:glycosyltransferase involved in cell wall biosynthesis
LRRSLDALFAQDLPGCEIIVVNDGSTDGTHEYLTALAAERRIVYIHQQNMGPARARNAGIAAAKGEFLADLGYAVPVRSVHANDDGGEEIER